MPNVIRSTQNWINRYPAFTVIVILVLLLFAVWQIVRQLSPRPGPPPELPTRSYFYDLETAELVEESVTTLAPSSTADGRTLVRAVVFSCGDCGQADQRFIGYYERLSKQALAQAQEQGPMEWQFHLSYATPMAGLEVSSDAKKWVAAGSLEGMKLQSVGCRGGEVGPPQPCAPR